MGTLLKLQFKQLFGNFSKKQGTSNSKGTAKKVLIIILFGYLILLAAVVSSFLCLSLLAFCNMGKGWVYFAFIGVISLAFGVLMSVFATQNMLYGTKDNEFLLSLPIKPDNILMSRIIVLLALNTVINLVFTVPAGIIYAVNIGFSIVGFLCYLLSIVAFPMIVQAISCVFGWLLNKLYQKFNNKAFISLIFMLLFFEIYFYIYPKIMSITDSAFESKIMLSNDTVNNIHSWGWPLFAYGKGCEGDFLYALCFLAIALGIFALVYGVIRINYLKTLLATKSSGKLNKKAHKLSIKSPVKSVCFKELRLFFTCPVYLTNMGLGILLIPIMTIAGIIFKSDVVDFVNQFSFISNETGNIISLAMVCAVAFLASMTIVSAASISLEGKSLWILKSLPISGKTVVKGKLLAHIVLVVPISVICGFVLSLCFNADFLSALMCAVNCGLVGLLVGVLGLIFNLLVPRFDWVNEVTPCKQSMAVMLTMFISMFYSIAIAIVSGIVFFLFSPAICMLIQFALLIVPTLALYLVLIKWGAKKFETVG